MINTEKYLQTQNDIQEKELKRIKECAELKQVFFPVVNGEMIKDQSLTFSLYNTVDQIYSSQSNEKKIMDTYNFDQLSPGDLFLKQRHIAETFKNRMYSKLFVSLSGLYKKYELIIRNDEDLKEKCFNYVSKKRFNRFNNQNILDEIAKRVFSVPYRIYSLDRGFINRNNDDNYNDALIDILDISSYLTNDLTIVTDLTISFTSFCNKELKKSFIDQLLAFGDDDENNDILSLLTQEFNNHIEYLTSDIYDMIYCIISEGILIANQYREYSYYNCINEKVEETKEQQRQKLREEMRDKMRKSKKEENK